MGQCDAAGQHDVEALLLLQRADLLDRIAPEYGGVPPLRVVKGAGDHILLDPVEVVGDAGPVVGLQGPVAAEVGEGLPAQQQGVGKAVLPVVLLHQIRHVDPGLTLRVEPVAEHLDGAVEGDVLHDRERAHIVLS
ncbi:MAG TPA: hypothetical protein VIT42_08785 [Microlunatus sp.]